MNRVCKFYTDTIRFQDKIKKDKTQRLFDFKEIYNQHNQGDQLGNALGRYIDLEKVDQENYKTQF